MSSMNNISGYFKIGSRQFQINQVLDIYGIYGGSVLDFEESYGICVETAGFLSRKKYRVRFPDKKQRDDRLEDIREKIDQYYNQQDKWKYEL